jgi:DDE superfamily endonuclease/Homeodomain-like domain
MRQRRLRAADLFAHGTTQAEVARTMGVSRQAALVWYRRWQASGPKHCRAPAAPAADRACPPTSSTRSSRPCWPAPARTAIVFFDEADASLTPIIRRTWAPRGKTPVLHHPFKWKRLSMAAALCDGSHGGGARLAFHAQPVAYATDSLIVVLGELRRFLAGEKATLIWDNLPAHHSFPPGALGARHRPPG